MLSALFFLDTLANPELPPAEVVEKELPKEEARRKYGPQSPQVMVAATLGYAGYFTVPRERGSGAELTLQLDLETYKPIWISAVGRLVDSRPTVEPLGELRIGYEFEWASWKRQDNAWNGEWIRLRPFVGARTFQFPTRGTSADTQNATAPELGVECALLSTGGAHVFHAFRGHVTGAIDARTREPWVEVELLDAIALDPRAIGGPTLGIRYAASEAAAFFGGFVGAQFEL